MKSQHQQAVEKFMEYAGQGVPPSPCMPDAETRLLRARLILEEAFEAIERGLGVNIYIQPCTTPFPRNPYRIDFSHLSFSPDRRPDLVELADGCADLSVVTVGTLSAAGISDLPLLETVDANNLAKFGPGGYRREDGKWVKPPGHQPPDILGVLGKMGFAAERPSEAID